MADARPRSSRTLWLILAVCIAPVVASYVAYFLFPRDAQTNYGELLPTQPMPAIAGVSETGTPVSLAEWRGKWVVLTAAPGACPPDCQRRLYAMRQARTIQNREQDRLLRAWLVTDDTAPAPALLAEHPGLTRVRVSPAALSVLPRGGDAIYLIDPLGNQVLVWPADPDIKAMARDIGRVLKASRIG